VNGVYNAILVDGDLVGKVLFYGKGAGPLPTSSAVVSDVIACAQDYASGAGCHLKWCFQNNAVIRPMSEIETRYYLRMNVADQAGVLSHVTRVLGEHNISISSIIQKETDETTQTAEIVVMTHRAKEANMQQALKEMNELPVVKEVSNFVRVED
jgi:homoserine dehydrogenase